MWRCLYYNAGHPPNRQFRNNYHLSEQREHECSAVVTMAQLSHSGCSWRLSALVTDDMPCAIVHITTQAIPLIGNCETFIILVRSVNMSARQW